MKFYLTFYKSYIIQPNTHTHKTFTKNMRTYYTAHSISDIKDRQIKFTVKYTGTLEAKGLGRDMVGLEGALLGLPMVSNLKSG